MGVLKKSFLNTIKLSFVLVAALGMYLPGCPSPTDSEVKRNFSWERVSMKAEPLEFPF